MLAAAWYRFVHAARFLTRAPLPDPGVPTPALLGQAVLFYPLVGALLGAGLGGLVWLLAPLPSTVAAALVLAVWVGATGALHLDGLADCADAWVGGLGDRARTLEILRDARIGAMGAVALIVALLVKWAALQVMCERHLPLVLWLSVPALARNQLLLLGLTTPYAREHGLGAVLRTHLPRRAAGLVWLGTWLLAAAVLGYRIIPLAVAAAVVFGLWRRALCQRLGGFTGDGAGALVELSEIALLLALLIVPG